MKTKSAHNWDNLLIPQGAVLKDLLRLIPAAHAPLPPVIIPPTQYQLKKFVYAASMSEETNAFTADIWFKGRRVGYARNDGHGGSTLINSYPTTRELLEEAKAWAQALPPQSSYSRLYQAIQYVDNEYMEVKEINTEAWWFSTSSMDLESLVDEDVCRRVTRQAYKGSKLKKLIICGTTPERAYPTLQEFKVEITPLLLPKLAANYGWAVPLAEFLELPFHYYPAPHNYAGGWPRVSLHHKKLKVTGEVQMSGTTDHAVSLKLEDGALLSVPLEDMHHLEVAKTLVPA